MVFFAIPEFVAPIQGHPRHPRSVEIFDILQARPFQHALRLFCRGAMRIDSVRITVAASSAWSLSCPAKGSTIERVPIREAFVTRPPDARELRTTASRRLEHRGAFRERRVLVGVMVAQTKGDADAVEVVRRGKRAAPPRRTCTAGYRAAGRPSQGEAIRPPYPASPG